MSLIKNQKTNNFGILFASSIWLQTSNGNLEVTPRFQLNMNEILNGEIDLNQIEILV